MPTDRHEPANHGVIQLLGLIGVLLALLAISAMSGQQPAPPFDSLSTGQINKLTSIQGHAAATAQLSGTPAHAPLASYRHNGPALLNDLTWTPGATGGLPQATLCSPDFHTGTVRNVPESVKFKVCATYGIARADCTGAKYEIDHLVSLELGGSNDVANLWPQPYAHPGAKEKDTVENWLHRQVCTGKLPLAEAQHQIALDWYQVYLTVPKANGGGGQ